LKRKGRKKKNSTAGGKQAFGSSFPINVYFSTGKKKKEQKTKKHKDAMASLERSDGLKSKHGAPSFQNLQFCIYVFRSKRSNAIKIIKPVAHVRSIVL
jgi:hypothetical protein